MKLVFSFLTIIFIIASISLQQQEMVYETKIPFYFWSDFCIMDIKQILADTDNKAKLELILDKYGYYDRYRPFFLTKTGIRLLTESIRIHYIGVMFDINAIVDCYQGYQDYYNKLTICIIMNEIYLENPNYHFLLDLLNFLNERELTGYYIYQVLQLPRNVRIIPDFIN